MQIQPATLDDCRAIAELHVESWRHAYQQILPAAYLASLSVAESRKQFELGGAGVEETRYVRQDAV
jgi:hypothetical protein